jgi:hypothetical protein
MSKHYIYLCLAIVFSSCATKVGYIGNSYNPTSKVDVFVDEGAIKRNYDIVGKGYVRSVTITTPEKIQSSAIETAKQKGADAILIKDYLLPVTGINTSLRTDTLNKALMTVGNTTVQQSSTERFVVLFLKYTE